jgi:hypothetical protein
MSSEPDVVHDANADKRTKFDVFLSYSRRDVDCARSLSRALRSQGWSVFMDEEIPNAEYWERVLWSQLKQVRCVLVLWSSAARGSEWVRREATEGRNRQVLAHARLDPEPLPHEFSALQAADLSDWHGQEDHHGFLAVLKAVAQKVGPKASVGTLPAPKPFENVTANHLALTSTSWRRNAGGAYPYQIHLRVVGTRAALERVANVVYYFDPAYAHNRPERVDKNRKAYVHVKTNWREGFKVYELAHGWSVVRAAVNIKQQGEIVWLSRLVDITEQGAKLNELYETWPVEESPSSSDSSATE